MTHGMTEDFMADKTWHGQVYSQGWTTSHGGDIAVTEPATGAEIGRAGVATPRTWPGPAARAAAAQPDWAAASFEERAAVLRRAGALIERNAARASALAGPRAGLDTAEGRVRDPHRRAGVLRGGRAGVPPARRDPAHRRAAAEPGAPGAGRRGRRDRAVQLPADPRRIRSVAPALALGNAVVLKPDAAHGGRRRVLDRAGLRGGRAARRAAARAARRRRGRRRAGRPIRAVRVVSFTGSTSDRPPRWPSWPAGTSSGSTSSWAATRRWSILDDADLDARRLGRRLGLVPAPGPDLHDRRPAPRAREPGRRLRRARWPRTPSPAGRRPGHRAGRARPAHRRRASGTRCTRLVTASVDAGRTACRRRHVRRAVLPPDRARRGQRPACRRTRGGLRSGRAGRAVLHRGRGGASSPPTAGTACRWAS